MSLLIYAEENNGVVIPENLDHNADGVEKLDEAEEGSL